MNVAIVGYGVEGRSALTYWLEKGADVTVCDKNPELDIPINVKQQLGVGYLNNLGRFDIIVRTVGMHPKLIFEKNPGVEGKITTNINEFLAVSPTKNIIGVTGTKGKGTTSTLILKMLEAAGKQAFLGANYGTPAFSFLSKLDENSWVVLELSSYMLYDLKHSPHIAICLMVHPEHLDWHGDKDDYFRSKANLFKHQNENDIAIYYADNLTSHKIASHSPGRKITYFAEPGAYVQDDNIMIDKTVICKTGELKLLGEHNWQNVCAAITVFWQILQTPDVIREVVTNFSGLPHRLELVREIDGIRFYNDSFASDPYATQAAIDSIPGGKVMIVGGYERMLPLKQFAKHVKDRSKELTKLVLIGQSAARVAEALQNAGYDNFHISTAKTMPEIVVEAIKLCKKGDAVVLSPGFASFDMFKDFEERGNAFKQVVHDL